jgi:hypothetical protein
MEHKKGTYVDGHERSDVVEYRSKFLRRLCSLGFLNKHDAPTPEAVDSLPSDLECPSDEQIAKTVVITRVHFRQMMTKRHSGEQKIRHCLDQKVRGQEKWYPN